MNTPQNTTRYIIPVLIILSLIAGYAMLSSTGAMTLLENSAALKQWILKTGNAGPLVIIGFMIIAIVMSPIPSAPVALAAGALYGHTAGTLYIVIGSGIGAVIAFYISRLAGTVSLHHWVDKRLTKTMLGSQNTLMTIVFVSRLMPFISFDIVSYAAGVTPLKFWRFIIATLAGIIPASFLLAHFGSELVSGESQRIGITVLLLGGVSLILMLLKWFSRNNEP